MFTFFLLLPLTHRNPSDLSLVLVFRRFIPRLRMDISIGIVDRQK